MHDDGWVYFIIINGLLKCEPKHEYTYNVDSHSGVFFISNAGLKRI
jgi:hypothetical protein